jgi:hypothetical protein
MRPFVRVALGVASALATACGTQVTRGYPLYPRLGDGPGAEKVATLHGPIQTVDGQDVSSKGQTFELMPGCHIVTLQRNIGEGGMSGAWAANLPRLTVAFEMKPAHRYGISIDAQHGSAPRGRVMIAANEKAPDGAVVRVPFARSVEDIDNCRRWADSQRF